MSRPFIALGSVPWKATPAKFGEPNYRTRALRDCQSYIQAIRQYVGREPEGAELDVKLFDSDRGVFYEVVCYFDDDNDDAEYYAHRCEREAPQTWQEGGVQPPLPFAAAPRSR